MRKTLGWVRRHPVYSSLIVLACGLAGLNLVAYRHAQAMIWFVPSGLQTPPPRELSLLGKLGVLMTGVRVPRPVNRGSPADHQLDYSMLLVPVDEQVMLEAWRIPAASPRGTVILFHGYAGSRSDLLPEAAAFHELGFDVVLVDFRGSGGSSESYTTIGYVDYAPSCQCPTLLLHGELDRNARPEEGRNVQGHLGDHAAELVLFPETGHAPTLAADPQRWQSAIQRLLERVRP